MVSKARTNTISMYESHEKKIEDYMSRAFIPNFSRAARNLINLGYAKFLEMEANKNALGEKIDK